MTDPNTGLPELPKGMFWRTTKEYRQSMEDAYYIEIRTKRWWGGSALLFSKRIREGLGTDGHVDYSFNDASIRYTAGLLHREFLKWAEGLMQEVRLLGDFPPNRVLND